MPEPNFLSNLVGVTRALEQWLEMSGIEHVLVGGFAVAFQGRTRVTADVDAVVRVDMEGIEGFVGKGERFGFRLREVDGLELARRRLVICLVHAESGIQVDLSLALTSFENEAIDSAERFTVEGVSFPLASPEHLLVMKAFARRDKDLQDIDGLLDRHPEADLAAVRRWLKELGAALDDPTYVAEFDQLISRRRGRSSQSRP